jgi:UDP-N-acetylmuramoyl-tripeptide--D-alanyl-D-alanine ligase
MFFALRGERVDGNQYAASAVANGAAFAVIDDPAVVPDNPGEADRYLLVEDSQTALQQLATHHRSVFRMPVLAVTGSNGKTTTKELIAAVMGRQYRVHATPGNYNNHLGLPLTILSTPPGTEFLLLEMGANHVGEIAALCRIGRPTHGLVTNIGDAHLEGFGGRSGIIRGKGELYDYLAAHRGIAFVNGNEEHLADMAAGVDRVIHYLDSEHPAPEVPGMEIRPDAVSPNVAVSFLSAGELISVTTHLSGRHNLQNIKTAIAVGKYFKVAGRQIAAALKDYRPDNHRSQWMTHRGVRFYWDAYNANPSSVMAALESFAALTKPADSVVILGEMLELGAASEAAHRSVVLRAGQVARTVLLVGDQMRDTAREFDRPHFADSTALRDWFWAEQWEGKQVFVKGSRGNRLERLLDQDTGSSRE